MTTETGTKNLKEKIENLQKDIERLTEISVMHSQINEQIGNLQKSSRNTLAILKHLDDTLAKQDELDHVKEDISQVKALLHIQIYATILNNNT